MFWVVYFTSLAVMIIVSVILERTNNSSCLLVLVTYVWGMAGLCLGLSMPHLYIVRESGEIDVRKRCIRRSYKLEDGTRVVLPLGSTTVVNESGLNLCLEDVQYLRRDYFGIPPAFIYRDTTQSRVLRFRTEDVSAFEDAPSYLEDKGIDLVRRIIVVSLERQRLCPMDTCYRGLFLPEDDYYYDTNL